MCSKSVLYIVLVGQIWQGFFIKTASAQDSCELGGQTFQRGQNVGSAFETLCGSSDDFPCFCNPDNDPPVDCPYCGMAAWGDTLVCSRDNESVTFLDINGIGQTCQCTVTNGAPSSSCQQSGTCTLTLPDGTSRNFANGESISDFFPNRCGDDFPCFCNPDVVGQIECPYCRLAGLGGSLTCARDDETVTYQKDDGTFETCSCEIPPSPGAEGIATCTASAPAPAPVAEQTDLCTFEDEDGQIVTFFNGQSLGEYFTTLCGSSEDFPCYCNTALSNNIECPYCGFAAGDGSLYCAGDGEVVSFVDGSITRVCSCDIPNDPSLDPIKVCNDASGPVPIATATPTTVPTRTPSQAPANGQQPTPTEPSIEGCAVSLPDGESFTIGNGETFGNIINGICGSSQEWPAFCNVDLVDSSESIINAIARQFDTATLPYVEYPYCIFDETQDGRVVCARNGQQVTFVDADGVTQRCNCVVRDVSLGGPQSSCEAITSPTSPTGSPTIQPEQNIGDDDDSPTQAPAQARSSGYSHGNDIRRFTIFIATTFLLTWKIIS